jgi:hypothetical protein
MGGGGGEGGGVGLLVRLLTTSGIELDLTRYQYALTTTCTVSIVQKVDIYRCFYHMYIFTMYCKKQYFFLVSHLKSLSSEIFVFLIIRNNMADYINSPVASFGRSSVFFYVIKI